MLPRAFLAFSPFLLLWSAIDAVVVDTEYGQVRGSTVPVNNGRLETTVDAFNAIPYGRDMSGTNRFRNPLTPDPWSGIREATVIGDACPQNPNATLPLTHPGWDRMAEDCLHLNIFSPNVSSGPYPVMVWFHGGGLNSGANFQYNGHFLATYGVVMVSVNYRINKLGWAFTNTPAAPGNAGLWDMKLAIEFVQNNIANFGGDPEQITLFGESAGGLAVSLHVLSPQSKDLFQRAIMQSGAEVGPGAMALPEDRPEDPIYPAAEALGCSRPDDEQMMDCLRTVPVDQLVYAQPDFGGKAVVDGPGGFVPLKPIELRESGDVMNGPILAGINHDEAAIYIPGVVPEIETGCCNRSEFVDIVANRLLDLILDVEDPDKREDFAKAIDFNYAPWPHVDSAYGNRDAFEQIFSDLVFVNGWSRQVKAHTLTDTTYGYVYNYRGRTGTQIYPEWMGVPHGAELPFVFGYTLLPFNQAVRDDAQMYFDAADWTEEDVQHTIFIQELFTNFAKFGNPTPEPVPNPLGGTTTWPAYTLEDYATLVISNTSVVTSEGWREKDLAFWQQYVPYLVDQQMNKLFQ